MIQVLDEYPFTAQKIALTPEDEKNRLGHSQFGCCAATGVSRRPGERVVDTGMSVFDDTPNGDIIVSETYVRELANAIGYESPEKLAEARAEKERAEKRAEQAETRWAQSADAFRSLVTMIANDPAQATILAKQMLPKVEDGTFLVEPIPVDAFATGPAYKPKATARKKA